VSLAGYKIGMMFIKWLEGQQHREDAIGLLAREVHAEWGRNWKEVGDSFHIGGDDWPKTLGNLRRYLTSSSLDFLDSRFDYPPPVSKKALKGLEKAWSEWEKKYQNRIQAA
jgi:hypothetical protein